MKPIKVLHILHELKYSGAEIMYVDAAPVFQEKGCELSVVATANNLGEFALEFEKAGYKVYHKPYPKRQNVLKRIVYYYQFIKFLKKEKIAVVHNHSSATFWGMALCARLSNIKAVHTFHSVFPTSWYSILYHVLLRFSAKHIFGCTFQTISDSVYQNEKQRFHNKTIKIYNWYGGNRFYPASANEKELIREELKIPKNSLVLISIGGCSPIKRHSDIIKALPDIINTIPNCLYLHLGTGEIEQEEKLLAASLGITNYIRFYGNQKEVRKFLVVADIYLMTSKFEGISLTTIEAMACHIPCILYDVPGLRDFNKETQSAVLIPEDLHLLAAKIIETHQNLNLQDKIIQNANELVNSKFSMEKNAKKIFKLYIN